MPRRRSLEEFIAQARSIHGDKYTYDQVEYKNDSTKVVVTCPKHGNFTITPDSHIHSKNGCKKCAHERIGLQSRMAQDEFILRSSAIHSNFYSYDKVNYRDSHTKVVITCPVHGDFMQLPYHHLNGHGCKHCATALTREKESISTEEFILRARACHTIKYDYSKVEMKGANERVCIICPEHGEFWQTAATYLRGHDCPQCGYKRNSLKRTKSLESFVEEANRVHRNKYDYSKTHYITAKKKIEIYCKKHKIFFWQKPNAHLNGNGCPVCAQSHLETEVHRLLTTQKIHFQTEKTFEWLKYKGNLYLDFFLPEYSIAIECQGEQHFHACDFYGGDKSYRLTKHRDGLKKHLCEEHGIRIIYYSNLNIKYPYPVIESPEALLSIIQNHDIAENDHLWKTPELPFTFD